MVYFWKRENRTEPKVSTGKRFELTLNVNTGWMRALLFFIFSADQCPSLFYFKHTQRVRTSDLLVEGSSRLLLLLLVMILTYSTRVLLNFVEWSASKNDSRTVAKRGEVAWPESRSVRSRKTSAGFCSLSSVCPFRSFQFIHFLVQQCKHRCWRWALPRTVCKRQTAAVLHLTLGSVTGSVKETAKTCWHSPVSGNER